MYSPPPRWGWTRYLLWSATAIGAVLLIASSLLPKIARPPRPAPPRPPTLGRVSIPNVPRESDARFDDAIIAPVAERPGPTVRGCWRLRGAGNDAGANDRVECRLPADAVHLFEVRHPSGEPELWRITIPANDGEAILVH